MSAAPQVTGRVTTGRNKLGTLENVKALAILGFRAKSIERLTAASRPDILDILEQLGLTKADLGGRQPRSLTTLMESVKRHVEASVFLRSYEEVLKEFYAGGRGIILTDALITAYTHLKSLIPDPEFLPDQAVMIAGKYHAGEVKLARCPHSRRCPCVFMVSTQELTIRQHVTVGDCPLCRELYSMKAGRSVVRIPDSKTQRELLGRFAD